MVLHISVKEVDIAAVVGQERESGDESWFDAGDGLSDLPNKGLRCL